MAEGYFIPFRLKLANLLASEGLTVSFVTTTNSASKLQSRAVGSAIHFVPLSFPYIDALSPGCESVDALSMAERMVFFCSSHKLSVPFEQWWEQVIVKSLRKPACIISLGLDGRFGIQLLDSAGGVPYYRSHECFSKGGLSLRQTYF